MSKRRKKIPLRKQLSRAHRKADKIFSLYIRKRDAKVYDGKCLICRTEQIQCAFHVVRRGRKILRWHEQNVFGTCHRCNYTEYRNPDISRAWYIHVFGADQYLTLVEKSLENFVPTLADLENIIKIFTEKLKQV